MNQYLLSVHYVDGTPATPEGDMEVAYAKVNDFNQKLQDTGAWVFAGGLFPLSQNPISLTRGHLLTEMTTLSLTPDLVAVAGFDSTTGPGIATVRERDQLRGVPAFGGRGGRGARCGAGGRGSEWRADAGRGDR